MTTSIRRFMRAVPLLAAGLALHAQAQVYSCRDKEGRLELTDTAKRGCKQLDLPGYIQAPPARQAPARQGGSNARPPVAAPAPAPGDFPRVGAAEQRARDDDRRTILDDELRNEQKKLLDLKRDFNNGAPERQAGEKDNVAYQQRVSRMREDIARAESNIEALKREIASIR
jgi:hypothetical protein